MKITLKYETATICNSDQHNLKIITHIVSKKFIIKIGDKVSVGHLTFYNLKFLTFDIKGIIYVNSIHNLIFNIP